MLKRNVQKNAQMHLNVTPSIIFFSCYRCYKIHTWSHSNKFQKVAHNVRDYTVFLGFFLME